MATLNEALRIKDLIIENYLRPLMDFVGKLMAHELALATNLVGVGVGWHFSGGNFIPDDWVVRVYVRRKLPIPFLGNTLLLDVIEGVFIDVVETGSFRAIAGPPGSSVSIGSTIGLRGSTRAGTAGAIATDGHAQYLLTCSHVLHGATNDTVVLRASNGDELPIGKLAGATGFMLSTSATAPNSADAAIARLDPGIGFSGSAAGSLVAGPAPSLTQNDSVFKLNSHPLEGTVFDVNATIQVEYAFGTFWFKNQILVHATDASVPFGSGGESGSLVTHLDGMALHPVGLLFASGARPASGPVPPHTKLAAVCPIAAALAAFPGLNLQLITGG